MMDDGRDLLADAESSGLPSVDDAPPRDRGGSIARSGFAFQDDVAVSFLIDMLLDPGISKVHCETHDDLVVVRHGEAGRFAEFVQVKSGRDGKLWSVSDLCKGGGGRSVFAASLCRDACRERSWFRLVTTQGVDANLKILTYPRGSAARNPGGHGALEALIGQFHDGSMSAKGNGPAYWIENCVWDIRHSREAVKAFNLIRLQEFGRSEGRAVALGQADGVVRNLLGMVKAAGEADWMRDPRSKIITREQVVEAWGGEMARHGKAAARASSGTGPAAAGGGAARQRNIYLDVFNLDYRRIFRWDALLPVRGQVDALQEILAAAVFLCRDHCIMPPRFVLECPRVRRVVGETRPYFQSGLVRWPMRERDPIDFWEKKKRKMTDAWKDYPHMLDQTAFRQLNECARALTRYKPPVGITVSREWREAPDHPTAWEAVKQSAPAGFIDRLRHVPGRLVENGKGVTMSAIEALLPQASDYKHILYPVLAASYGRVYLDDLGLVVMTNLPYCGDDLGLGSKDPFHDFEVLEAALRPLGLWPLHRRFMPEELVALRSTAGYALFMDAYGALAAGGAHAVRRAFAMGVGARRAPPPRGAPPQGGATPVGDASDWMGEVAERVLAGLDGPAPD